MQPSNITKLDVEICKKLGKYMLENAKWDGLSSRQIMEIYQYLMWFNGLPKKLEDNIIEVTKVVVPPVEEVASE